MGRELKFNRDEAIEFCMHQIWQDGFESCSVKSISERLGITRSSFYNAFGSREALLLEVIELYASQAPDVVLYEPLDKKSVKQLFTSFFKEVCRVRADDSAHRGCLIVNCITELVGNQEVGKSLGEMVASSVQRFEQILQHGVRAGELPDEPLRAKALALQNLLIGLSVSSKVIHSESELFLIARQSLEGFGLYYEQ